MKEPDLGKIAWGLALLFVVAWLFVILASYL